MDILVRLRFDGLKPILRKAQFYAAASIEVERMRQGASPAEAAEHVIRRIDASYDIRPEHQVGLIALAPDSTWAGAALRPGFSVAVRTSDRDELVPAGWVRHP